ncbi:alpha/beta fold hydrolase [Panacibacter ginsenosidivorans]|nr:alpha/beta hydrolase [Panacibacter ginsenosidivorans]
MDIQYLNLENSKIAYIENNKEAAQTIFFIHGNSVSKRSWRKQYNSDILSAYRMVAIDLPAHGDSDAFDTKNYTLPGLAKLMCEAVKQLSDNKPYILAGISLSTNIIAEMLAYDVAPKGLVLAGPCIVGKDFTIEKFVKPNTHVGVVFTDEPAEVDVHNYGRETCLSKDEDDINIFMEDFKAVKNPFRSSLAQSITTAVYNDEIALLQQHNIPSLIIFGKDEIVIDPDYLDTAVLPGWNDKIYKIEGASHLVNIDQPEAFNKLLEEFATDIFK